MWFIVGLHINLGCVRRGRYGIVGLGLGVGTKGVHMFVLNSTGSSNC